MDSLQRKGEEASRYLSYKRKAKNRESLLMKGEKLAPIDRKMTMNVADSHVPQQFKPFIQKRGP